MTDKVCLMLVCVQYETNDTAKEGACSPDIRVENFLTF